MWQLCENFTSLGCELVVSRAEAQPASAGWAGLAYQAEQAGRTLRATLALEMTLVIMMFV